MPLSGWEKRLAGEATANESGSVSKEHNSQVLRSRHSKIGPANNVVKSARSVRDPGTQNCARSFWRRVRMTADANHVDGVEPSFTISGYAITGMTGDGDVGGWARKS
jgi:hypothetical protein